jgi:hypothetical protein
VLVGTKLKRLQLVVAASLVNKKNRTLFDIAHRFAA